MDHQIPTSVASNTALDYEDTKLPGDATSTITDGSRAAYAPQFSEMTALILRRIRSTAHGIGPKTPNENFPSVRSSSCRDKRLIPANSSTISLLNGAVVQHDSSSAKSTQERIATASSNLKRKRKSKADVPDFTQNTIFFPAPTSSHPITPPLIARQPSVPPKGKYVSGKNSSKPPSSLSIQAKTEINGEKSLSLMFDGIVPAKTELLGFFAGEASDKARIQYFMQKTRKDLLDILSFCDQCHPQLLVDIMVSVSKKHPDLPIFGSKDWESRISGSVSSPKETPLASPQPAGRPRHGHAITNPKARPRQKNSKKALGRLLVAQNAKNASPIEMEHEGFEEGDDAVEKTEEDTLPPTWPKAGEGLYAKLPLETEDRTFLTDENDDESFSQFLVDDFGKPVIISTCA